jgi:DNA-binding MarR family transcriptional regulator
MPQLRILFMLTVKDGATPGYLAERMRVTPSTITGLTDRLVRQDFIRRDEDSKDRRLVRLHITENGGRSAVSEAVSGPSQANPCG